MEDPGKTEGIVSVVLGQSRHRVSGSYLHELNSGSSSFDSFAAQRSTRCDLRDCEGQRCRITRLSTVYIEPRGFELSKLEKIQSYHVCYTNVCNFGTVCCCDCIYSWRARTVV